MQVDLTLKNYRCFPDSHPARLSIRKGFTAFVGPNNSGKSALLRFFFEFRDMLQQIVTPQSSFTLALRGNPASFSVQGIADLAELFSNENSRDLSIEFTLSPSAEDGGPLPDDALVRVAIRVPRGSNTYTVTELAAASQALPTGVPSDYILERGDWYLTQNGAAVALLAPLYSALRPLAQTVYLGAFRNAINIGGTENYFDIRVGEAFLRVWRQFKSGSLKHQAEAAVRLTDDIRHIFGFDRLELNTSDDGKSLQVIVNGKPFRLEELGSGLAQFVLVLASVATRQQGYILLDEPELNLHPSLQADFLMSLASHATEGVLFGTHSMGLARAVGQQIYGLKRVRQGVTEMRAIEGMRRLAEFLGEMSFSGYQELGYQRILLVEGPTEVTTLQQFLRKRNLDHKIVVLPLGGRSMITGGRDLELAEMRRISDDIHVLIDSERTSAGEAIEAGRQAFIATCDALGIRRHVLERRATENYFSERAIQIALKSPSSRALGFYENLKDGKPAWAKQENWRIAREMTLEELNGTDLGEFIRSL